MTLEEVFGPDRRRYRLDYGEGIAAIYSTVESGRIGWVRELYRELARDSAEARTKLLVWRHLNGWPLDEAEEREAQALNRS